MRNDLLVLSAYTLKNKIVISLYTLFSNLDFKGRFSNPRFDKWVCFSWERNKGAQVMGLSRLILITANTNNDGGDGCFINRASLRPCRPALPGHVGMGGEDRRKERGH